MASLAALDDAFVRVLLDALGFTAAATALAGDSDLTVSTTAPTVCVILLLAAFITLLNDLRDDDWRVGEEARLVRRLEEDVADLTADLTALTCLAARFDTCVASSVTC